MTDGDEDDGASYAHTNSRILRAVCPVWRQRASQLKRGLA